MIRSIIIDDELHCVETLGMLLNSYCPDVQIVAQCRSAKDGLIAIEKFNPDLVFLDVEMPGMNGFEMLEQFAEIPFAIIFTTSYDQYAIKAIHYSALEYLLKPVDPKDLVGAIHKVQTRKFPPSMEQFHLLLSKIQDKENGFSKVPVPTSEGFELIPVDLILRCEADDNYTYLHIKNSNKIVACRTLKEMEGLLGSFSSFVRVHHSHIVNLNEVTKYVRGEGGYLVMSDGSSVNVSRSRKDALLRLLGV